MLYEHVRLLRELGHEACALQQRAPFRPGWLEVEVPLRYLDEPGFAPGAADVVVVPEVQAASETVRRYPWRRVVFVQGSFLILSGTGGAVDYRALGYEAAMAVLPYTGRVVERHFGLAAHVVPPFVAPYFFEAGSRPRQKRVLLVVKDGYRQAGYLDHEIAGALLARDLARRPGWSLVPLTGYTHREVADLMKSSTFLVNVNSLEAFNTTVPEAMAAGCIALCYEAVGGRDFLRDGENAIVFPTHDVYALVERVGELIDEHDGGDGRLARLREGGRRTAASFNPAATSRALGAFFSRLRPPSP
jgi:glycosyltransferase involved in cell wall biosynthesis